MAIVNVAGALLPRHVICLGFSMNIIATHINYYHVCKRKLWLFANGIQMEHTSELVAEGKLIGENSYSSRSAKYTELEVAGVRIDFYDAKNKIIHEVKKSDKIEKAHIWQVKYYLYILDQQGISGATGIIEYPKLRKKECVVLLPDDILLIKQWEREIPVLVKEKSCPTILNKAICKKCSYNDFCYIAEDP